MPIVSVVKKKDEHRHGFYLVREKDFKPGDKRIVWRPGDRITYNKVECTVRGISKLGLLVWPLGRM